MKLPLYRKFLLLYFVILIPVAILLSTICRNGYQKEVISDTKTQLFKYSHYIRESYFPSVYKSSSSLVNKKISEDIRPSSRILNTTVWITNAKGLILVDSQEPSLQNGNHYIKNYDAGFFHKSYHVNKTLKPIMRQEMLTVILPVTSGYAVKGYIIIHTPMETINQQMKSFTYFSTIGITAFAIIYGILLYIIYTLTGKPAKKICNIVSKYNNGEFEDTTLLRGKDEYEFISTELSYLGEQLQHLDDYQKNFIANVSHDFRSPLTSIKGYAEAMLDGTIPEELYNKYLDIIVFETERLTKLTTNLLSLNGFEHGRTQLEITSFDINYIIKRTVASFEGTCTKKHIKLVLTFSEKETFVNADQAKIQQVLYNLIDNAIKFSHKDSQIKITTIEKKEKVILSVKDYGIGIPKNSLKKIWERFYKTDLSRGKDQKGTGLGLSITKEIINAHQEHINVTSTEGSGTEFSFTLPLTNPSSTS